MGASASDLVIVLTGGSGNSNPNHSIGGEPSATPIMGVLNNLFDNISETEANAGQIDYRCIYIFNNNSGDSFYNVRLYLDAIIGTDTNIKLGLMETNEIQKIVIFGSVTGGSFDVNYIQPSSLTPIAQTINYNADPSVWAINLQTALTADFPGIIVNVEGDFSNRIFRITFGDFRNHDLLGLDTTNLIGTSISGTVSKLVGGSPINAIPPLLDASTTPPSGVDFSLPTAASPIIIGTLFPEEGFPIWLRRSSPAGALPSSADGFTLKLIASPISS